MKPLNLIIFTLVAFGFAKCTLNSNESISAESEISTSINLDEFIGSYSGLLVGYNDSGLLDSMAHEGRILKDDSGVFYTDLTDEPIDSIQYFYKWRIHSLVENELDTNDPYFIYKVSTTLKGDSFIRVFEDIHKYPDTAREPYFKNVAKMVKSNKKD